jgi:hypothetical protein
MNISLNFTNCWGMFAAASSSVAVTIAALLLRGARVSSNDVGTSYVKHLTTDGFSVCSFTVTD